MVEFYFSYVELSRCVCSLYRWRGTHMDEEERFLTRGAVAVRTFLLADAAVIVVAQSLPSNPEVRRFDKMR